MASEIAVHLFTNWPLISFGDISKLSQVPAQKGTLHAIQMRCTQVKREFPPCRDITPRGNIWFPHSPGLQGELGPHSLDSFENPRPHLATNQCCCMCLGFAERKLTQILEGI